MQQDTRYQSYFRISMSMETIATQNDEIYVICAGESVIKQPFSKNYSPRDDYQLMIFTGGKVNITLNGNTYTLHKGEALLMSPMDELSINTPEPMNEWVRYSWIHFVGSTTEEFIKKCEIKCSVPFSVSDDTDIMEEIENLYFEFRMRSDLFDLASSLSVKRILMLLGRQRGRSNDDKLDKSLCYIHSHFRHKISVSDLASLEFLGTSRYRELFRKQTGMSPVEYISALRIEKAKDLLTQEDLSLAKIASMIGYDDVHYFQRVFKKCVGITAGDYRKSVSKT